MMTFGNIEQKDRLTCRTRGCFKPGQRWIGDRRVCWACFKRYDRATRDDICSVSNCDGRVVFAKNISGERFCRTHERKYLELNPDATAKALDHIGKNIRVDQSTGCWLYGDEKPTNKRSQILCDGLRWNLHRFLYNWFFGGHKGGLELHHGCENPWCVHPGHLLPTTGKRNRMLESSSDPFPDLRELSRNIVRDFYFSTPELDEFIMTHGLALDEDWRISTEAALSN